MKRLLRRGLKFTLTLFCLFVGAMTILYLYMELQLPDVSVLNDVHMQVPITVYSSDNQLIAEYGAKRRMPVQIEQVPKQLINAILATEDARFYSHPGVDFVGLVRAFVAVVSSGRKVQGASTITMQVARNFFLTSKKTYSRKFKEILLAIKIDRELSKEKILELYLNKVYFGNRAYGVAAAAFIYYGKSLDQLSLPEMAMIAGLPQAPSRNNPLSNPAGALKRRNHVLARMLEVGYINKIVYDKAIQAPLTSSFHEQSVQLDAPYIAEMVRQALVKTYGDNVYDQGFKVYTTVASPIQKTTETVLQEGLIEYSAKKITDINDPPVEGAVVVMNPQNGAILALQGGYDYDISRFNRAIQAQRQSGSNFKPFIYSAALANGMTLATVINDSPIMMKDNGENAWWRPHNDNYKFYGPTRLRYGLTHSRNLVSIRILRDIGLDKTLAYLNKFGFDTNQLPHSLSLALGSGVVTPLQIARGYSVFANGGRLVNPYFIQKIVDQQNKVIYEAPTQDAPQVITPQNAYLMTQAMRDVIASGTGKAAKQLNRVDLAGKTGTTNDQVDAWFSGFNNNVLATVWIGFDDPNRSLKMYGSQIALPIWIQIMKKILHKQPAATMAQPSDIVTARIDPSNGLLAGPHQKAIFEVFQKDHVPTQFSVKHYAAKSTSVEEEHIF